MVQKFFGRSFELILVRKKKKGGRSGKMERKKRKKAGILDAPRKRGERGRRSFKGARETGLFYSFHAQIHPSPLCQSYISKTQTDPPLTKPP